MDTVIYEGGFEEWLCAVFAVYEYKVPEACIVRKDKFMGTIFGNIIEPGYNRLHSERVWKGLQKKLTAPALKQLYAAFLSEREGIENTLLQYVQHVFSNPGSVESDFGHPAVLLVQQTAKKVDREKHHMEAFVRFRKTADNLFYAVVEPDHNVLPLIGPHFRSRYADQRWLIFDGRRRYGIYFDGHTVENVTIAFAAGTSGGAAVAELYDADEEAYQGLWQQYFSSVNIGARKNRRLQLQQMPRRYWKHMTEIIKN